MKLNAAAMLAALVGALSIGSTLAAQTPPVAPTGPRLTRMGLSTIGALVFQRSCSGCHVSAGTGDGADPRAPKLETLRQFPPERILDALTSGKMQTQGAALSETDRREVSEWLSTQLLGAAKSGDAAAMPNRCAPGLVMKAGPSWNGWGVDARNGRFQSAAAAGLTAANLPKLQLKWAFGMPGGVQVFSQPTVYGGRVFVGSDSGQVYGLDAATGCVHWSFLASGGVRTAPLVIPSKAGPLVVVGDLKARVYAIDARDGHLVWSVKADDQPLARLTGAPVAFEGRLYVPVSTSEENSAHLPGYVCCRHRGSVVAMDAADGRQLWKTYMITPEPRFSDTGGRKRWGPAGGGVWSSPTVDAKRGRLYVTTGDAYAAPAGGLTDAVVALDLATGKVVWAQQDTANDVWVAGCTSGAPNCPDEVGPDWDFGGSAMLQTLAGGRDVLVAAHKGGVAIGLDPTHGGKVLWRVVLSKKKAGSGGADILFGGALDRRNAYFALQETSAVVALDLATGTQRWSSPIVTPADRASHHGAGAAVSGFPGAVLSGGWDGVLRAYSAADGRPLWQVDTMRSFPSVNGIMAKGGSMGAPGPTIAGGMLFVGSGYVGTNDGVPGNALLAFGL